MDVYVGFDLHRTTVSLVLEVETGFCRCRIA